MHINYVSVSQRNKNKKWPQQLSSYFFLSGVNNRNGSC